MFQELFCISFISSSANHVEILFFMQHWKIKEHNSYILHRMGLLMNIRILIISFSLYQSFRPQNGVSFKWYWKLISINKMMFNKALYYLHVFNVFFYIKIKVSIWHYKSVYLTNDTVSKIPNRSRICWIYICMIFIIKGLRSFWRISLRGIFINYKTME